jgi:transposase-like protein
MSALNQPHFQDADKAREYLERIQWPHGPVCPHCGVIGQHYQITGKASRPGLWKCKDCREQFTVTVGTVFERSKIKLNVWLQAVFLLCSSKKGMSSHQLHRVLGVTYKTAWFMTHRIREAMTSGSFTPMGGTGKTVEADETYYGQKRTRAKGRSTHHKHAIFSLVERQGKVRSWHIANVNGDNVRSILRDNVKRQSNVYTDDHGAYRHVKRDFIEHQTVAHSQDEYVRGPVHTNTIEGYFSILKRGLVGTYHHVSEQHLQRYVSEFDFRYNTRTAQGFNDNERTNVALKGITGKRLTYRRSNTAA